MFICDFRTCLNGGYCVGNATVSLDFSTCVCPNGYTGKYCEAVIDPCLTLTKPCGDNGKCYYSAPGQYVCRVRFDLINKDLTDKEKDVEINKIYKNKYDEINKIYNEYLTIKKLNLKE